MIPALTCRTGATKIMRRQCVPVDITTVTTAMTDSVIKRISVIARATPGKHLKTKTKVQ